MHLQAAPAVSFQLWASTLTSTVSRPTLCSDLIFSDEFYMSDQPEDYKISENYGWNLRRIDLFSCINFIVTMVLDSTTV